VAGSSGAVPERTAAQRVRALGLANEVRSGQAKLKRELAAGRVELAGVIVEPPACVRTARVYELLLAVPKVGPAKATRWLSHCRIAPSKTVVGLSERQRRELLEQLRC
jgi:S13-like protein